MSSSSSRHRRLWTRDEDDVLRRAAEAQAVASNGSIKDWCAIAKLLPCRTNKDCRKRYAKVIKSINKGSWHPSEDERLIKAIEACGNSWQLVAERVGTRHAERAKRWQHSLNPAIDRSEWTAEDDQTLINAVHTVGRSWRVICKSHFPRRSTTDIKNHFEFVCRRRKHSNGSRPEDGRRSGEIQEERPENGAEMAAGNGNSSFQQQSPSYDPTVRRQHILTGSHPGPEMWNDYGSHGPAGSNPVNYHTHHDPLNIRTSIGGSSSMHSYPGDVSLNTFQTSPSTMSNTIGSSSGSRSPHDISLTPYTPIHQHFNQPHDAQVSSWNQRELPLAESTHMSGWPPATLPGIDAHHSIPGEHAAYVQEHIHSGSQSPNSGYTLVLKQLPPENVGMVINPLMRSGVNVRMQVYNGE